MGAGLSMVERCLITAWNPASHTCQPCSSQLSRLWRTSSRYPQLTMIREDRVGLGSSNVQGIGGMMTGGLSHPVAALITLIDILILANPMNPSIHLTNRCRLFSFTTLSVTLHTSSVDILTKQRCQIFQFHHEAPQSRCQPQ
jgi:hypothetical protein